MPCSCCHFDTSEGRRPWKNAAQILKLFEILLAFEFFDAEEQLLLVDIGHYESEQYTSHRLMEILKEKFTNFAIRLSEINTNPINYL